MKKRLLAVIVIMLFAIPGFSQDVTFPRQLTNEGSVLTMYQPQVDSWEQYKRLHYRMAFTLKPNQGQEVSGVLYMSADTEANMETHRVVVNNFSTSKINFPSLEESDAKKMEETVRSFMSPDRSLVMSIEQIVACTPKVDTVKTVVLNNNPPVIFTSKRPTLLLAVEGSPVRAPASKENLDYVVNAGYPLFFSTPDSAWYLYDGLGWQQAKESGGPWAFTAKIPVSLVNLAKDTNWTMLKGTVPAVSKPDKKMPGIFYSEKVAELILFEGEPAYKTISGTKLKFATNTTSDIFFSGSDKQFYYLTAGRWFSSNSLNGPWTYATPDLPADFAQIPESSPAAAVLPFVPGTEQAKDAVMIAQIPTTIQVNATEAAKQVNIPYSGEPTFKPIDSTSLSYAVNTTEKVIKVNDTAYYACVKGIWFNSNTPNGPWQTSTSVPPVIYAQPVSSPVYNVTYVTQTVTSPNVIESSYTAGYLGVFAVAVPLGIMIAVGTGFYHPPFYYYPPYGYPMYYPYAMTYGMYAYSPYHYGRVAYHASYNPNTGMYGRSATAYGPYGKATVAQGYNPSTGTYARGASVSTPYGSRTTAQAYNPYTGASASTRQNSSPHAQWGSTTINNGKGQSASAGHITTAGGTTAAIRTKDGDMYASKNGELYRNTGNGWESAERPQPKVNPNNTSGTAANPSVSNRQANTPSASTRDLNGPSASTRPANTPSASTRPASTPSVSNRQTTSPSVSNRDAGMNAANNRGSFNMQEMNRESQNRQRGNMQTQNYNRMSSGRSYQGGRAPMRGGGGGGGRRR
ncbi:hypothetical protein [Flavitalea sp.]|nr:hypothetical protein [Flavitalea sp.]